MTQNAASVASRTPTRNSATNGSHPLCLYHPPLAALSQAAHEATAAGDTERVREIEAEIDRLAAQLWGLTDGELREIQGSLGEMQ